MISSIRQNIYEEWRQLVKREKIRRYGWTWVAIGLTISFAVILMM